jgi:hypothetical protein
MYRRPSENAASTKPQSKHGAPPVPPLRRKHLMPSHNLLSCGTLRRNPPHKNFSDGIRGLLTISLVAVFFLAS